MATFKGTQQPQEMSAVADWTANGTPKHTEPAVHGLDMGDEGMVGSHTNDRVMLLNAHPHQAHSVGYDAQDVGESYENHGFQAVHIRHGNRNKGAEHHPPLGLWDDGAVQHTAKTRGVFTDG
jgi:hypothetical protein